MKISKINIWLTNIVLFIAIILNIFGTTQSISSVIALSTLIIAGIICILKPVNSLYVLMTILPYCQLFKIGDTVFYPYLYAILLVRILGKTRKWSKNALLFIAWVILFEIKGFVVIQNFDYQNLLKWLAVTTTMLICLNKYYKEIEIKRMVQSIVSGTTILGIAMIIFDSNDVTLGLRARALGSLDANTIALYMLFGATIAMSYILLRKTNDKKQILLYGTATIIMLVAGSMAASKTYLVVLLMTIAIYSICLLKSVKKFTVVVIAMVVAVVIFMKTGLYTAIVDKYLSRIMTWGTNDLEGITTGRSEIYKIYIEYILMHPLVFLFGYGLLSYRYNFPGSLFSGVSAVENITYVLPHNAILESIMGFGIIGTLLILYLWNDSWKRAKRTNSTLESHTYRVSYGEKVIAWIPGIMFFVYIQSISLLYQPVTWGYIFLILCFTDKVLKSKQEFSNRQEN